MNGLLDKLNQLETRERLSLMILAAFLILVALWALLWFPHQAASKAERRLTTLKDTIQWMQAGAVQLSTNNTSDLSPSDKIQRISQQLGLSVQSQAQQGQIKLTTSHANYAVLANFLTQLNQQGLTLVSLQMQSQDGQIHLDAVVQ